MVASRAGEMIGEIALAMRAGMFTGRLAQTVHAYPTRHGRLAPAHPRTGLTRRKFM
jgi:pyruvate/2-oxoglutarate dehydrogenase complex dihydrolipoamide dehydrogenase (E3) component